MRKTQEQIINKAIKHCFSDEEISVLSRDNLTIEELKIIYDYFLFAPNEIDTRIIINEVEKCISFLKCHRKDINCALEYNRLLQEFLLRYSNEQDKILSNNKKTHIFRMYQFLLNHKNPEDKYINFSIFYSYIYMLENNFSAYHMNLLLRASLINKNACISYGSFFGRYPCLQDDYLYNCKKSLVYYLIYFQDIIRDFCPNSEMLDSLYDWENHKFCFEIDRFNDYFTKEAYMYHDNFYYELDKKAFFEMEFKKHPIIKEILKFCQNNKLYQSCEENNIFAPWRIYDLASPEKQTQLMEAYKILQTPFSMKLPAYSFSIKIMPNFFVYIYYNEYESIYVNGKNANGWNTGYNKPKRETSFMITPDGMLFKKMKNQKKYYPMSIKEFMQLYHEKNICGDFMKLLLDLHMEKNIFYKDVIKDMYETICYIPISFNEIGLYHNRTELILSKYKLASDIHIKWNRQNLNLSYFILKAYPYIDAGVSRQILLQQRSIDLLKGMCSTTKLQKNINLFIQQIIFESIKKFGYSKEIETQLSTLYAQELTENLNTPILSDEKDQWLLEKVAEGFNEDDIRATIYDYISMCRKLKIKIRLDIRSEHQLYKIHDKISFRNNDYRKMTAIVKIPKDSKFSSLQKMLPKEFEWIKTRKRLILETELQHHCVWSYADYITKDECAIYSYVDATGAYSVDGIPKRYTIEFRQKNGKYYVEQVQGKYDRANSQKMEEYIEMLLIDYNAV